MGGYYEEGRRMKEEYEILKSDLKVLKGKRIKMEYNGRILLDKVDPSPEEIISALYSGGQE